ncbi:MAG: PLDc N-terminal domain-containing protein [Actinomycetota bacterium]
MVLGVDVGPQELLVLLVVFVSPIWGIIDAALRPETQWQGASQNKVVWILIQLFLGFIGTIIYFAAIRPKLKRVSADAQASPE